MAMNCGCPRGAALPTIPRVSCKQGLGQLQRVIFRRRSIYTAGESSALPADTLRSLNTLSPLLVATDSTKIVPSPLIYNPTFTAGASRTYGGGNQTLSGIVEIIGREPTTFEGQFLELPQQDVVKPLKELMCEDICVYLIDEYHNIAGLCSDPTAASPAVKGIPIKALFIGDYALGGFEEPDVNAISWSFLPDWADDLYVIKGDTLDYDPISEL